MSHLGVEALTWLLAIFIMLSFVLASSMEVSEAYSHYPTSTTFYSSVYYLKCTFDEQVTVSSTEEISDLIKLYTSREEPVKIRATRRGFHSGMGFVCSGKRGSSYAEYHKVVDGGETTSITVLLHLLNRVVEADGDRHQLTVEAGMTLRELTLAAEANDMSVPPGTLSIYANLTVGGVILAGGHGSGYRTACKLGDLVRKVKWVDARGEIIVSDLETEHGAKEVRALVGGLGLLGIVTEVTLQLQPNSRTIVEIRRDLDDTNMVAEIKKALEEETPHVIVFWRPEFGTYGLNMWTQVEEGEYDPATMPKFYPNGGMAVTFSLPEQAVGDVRDLLFGWENDDMEESPAADALNAGICALSNASMNSFAFHDGTGTPVDHATVPTNFAMVSPDCEPNCVFDVHYMGCFMEDAEFTIKMSDFEDWVKDMKKAVLAENAETEARLSKRYGEGKVKRCSPGWFVLRFGRGDQNLLSASTGPGEDLAFVQIVNIHSAMIPNKLSKASTIIETFEQLSLCKYKGRPHWGKNHERTVHHPGCKVRDLYPAANIAELLELQHHHDPRKVFEPELFSDVMQKKGPDYSPLCSPHFWCYCAADSHCPSGFECRGSATFPEYKICKLALLRHDEL